MAGIIKRIINIFKRTKTEENKKDADKKTVDVKNKTQREKAEDFGAKYNLRFYHGSPIYIPRRHTIMSYAEQNRLAKKRRKTK